MKCTNPAVSARMRLRAIVLGIAVLAAAAPALGQNSQNLRLGVLFPGVIVDKDYNELGHAAMLKARNALGVEGTYRQRVTPADAPAVIREFIREGCTVIWGHGGQFMDAILLLSKEYPQVSFIAEGEQPAPADGENVHVLGREYHKGFYVLGALAAKVTRSNSICYIGGMPQPFARAQINAALTAIREYNPSAVFRFVNVGDFNDPMHSRQAAEAFIAGGCDVILSGVNLGNFGIIEAVNHSGRKVLFTTVYTSKQSYSPRGFLTSDMFDFTGPLQEVLERIGHGTRCGFIPMPWGAGKARYTLFPIGNVPAEVGKEIQDIAQRIATGEITAPNDMESLPTNPQ